MITLLLPGPGAILIQEPDLRDPFGTLICIEARHYKPEGIAMIPTEGLGGEV